VIDALQLQDDADQQSEAKGKATCLRTNNGQRSTQQSKIRLNIIKSILVNLYDRIKRKSSYKPNDDCS